MTTTTERLRTYWGARQIDLDRSTALLARYWEVALFGVLVGLALGMRLWDLSGRAVHHDESLHMYYAWQLFKGQGYEHVPFMHGPLQFFGSAFIFRLFGDSDYTARLLYALAGSALVAGPYFLRNYLGRVGALTAAFLLAVSPTLLYFSRFARGDIYMVAFTLGLAIVIWRYLKEQREALLYAVAPLLLLSFLTIEFTFITTAAFLMYLEFELTRDLVDQIRAGRQLEPWKLVLAYIVLLPTAWIIASLWPLLEEPRKNWSLTTLPPAGHLIVIIGTISVVQFGPAIEKVPLLHLGSKAFYKDVPGGENALFWSTTIILLLASAWIGMMWKARVWVVSALVFYVPFVLLYTTGFTNMAGFKSGIWGSLDYWLGQQFVRRGDQPDYYYFMTTPVYEFLPLIFALGGSIYYAFKGRLEQKLLAAAALLLVVALSLIDGGGWRIQASFVIVMGTVLLLSMDRLTKFLLFWALSVLFALTVSGEKMPWLTVHLAVPLALLAAKVMNDILSSVPSTFAKVRAGASATESGERPGGLMLENILPLVYGGGAALIAAAFFQAYGPASAISVIPWLLALAALAIVVRTAMRLSPHAAGQVAAVALFAAMVPFTLRAAGFAAYDQGQAGGYPQEMLIYAQGSPQLQVLNDQINHVAATSGLGRDLKLVIDNSVNIWPWPWYLRDHPYELNNFDGDFTPAAGSVVLISQQHQAKMQPYVDQYYDPIPYTHMWWFPEDYRGLQGGHFLRDLFSGHYIPIWRGYFIDRVVPGASNGPDMLAYFPKSFVQPVSIPTPNTGPVSADPVPAASVTELGGAGDAAGQFAQPADVSVDKNGTLYVVDTLNHRIERRTADGQWQTLGKQGTGKGEFGNPRSDTYQNDDGPWGIAVDDAGNIYVADTWNGRIQVFDKNLTYVRDWGQGEFFGPRDLAIDAQGNVLVVDTGNKRVAKYSPDGKLIQAYGKAGSGQGKFVSGSGPGEFNEPSSISIAPNGDIYVGDFWNKRIQIFDSQFRYRTQIEVKSWGSQGITDRAYIMALGDGHVLATDPGNGRILVFGADGTQVAAWKLPTTVGTSRPVGIAVDAAGQVYIADGVANRVVRVPLATLLTPTSTPAAQ